MQELRIVTDSVIDRRSTEEVLLEFFKQVMFATTMVQVGLAAANAAEALGGLT